MSSRSKDYYKILQVDSSAEQEIIEAAYKRLAQIYHPDANKAPSAESRMQEINAAYEVLRDSVKRARYDKERLNWATSPNSKYGERIGAREGNNPLQQYANDSPQEPRPAGFRTTVLLFIAAVVFGGVVALLYPYAYYRRIHYAAFVSLIILIFMSLFFVYERREASLKQRISIYQIKTLSLWMGFIMGWAFGDDFTGGTGLDKGLTVLIAWWLACACIGTLLCVGFFVRNKGRI